MYSYISVLIQVKGSKIQLFVDFFGSCTANKNRLQASPSLGECKNISQTFDLAEILWHFFGGMF